MANTIGAVDLVNLGTAVPASMGMVNLSAATSFTVVMSNAATAQKNTQTIESATVTQCCSLIISAGFAGAAKA